MRRYICTQVRRPRLIAPLAHFTTIALHTRTHTRDHTQLLSLSDTHKKRVTNAQVMADAIDAQVEADIKVMQQVIVTGRAIRNRMSLEAFRRWVLIGLVCLGLAMIARSVG